MKKIFFTFMIFILCIVNVNALDLSSKNVIMYNLDKDIEVMAINADEVVSIASLTKIMTTLVAIEKIKDMDELVTITYNMLLGLKEANAYVIDLYVGDKVSYRELLYGTFLASGADAVRALAFSLSGSEENFVKEMNIKAKSFGLTNTNFVNATGLDAEGHKSTVKEVAIMLKAALENDIFKAIYETETYKFTNKNLTVNNSTLSSFALLDFDSSYIIGGKTGYTYDAGRCLASTAYDSVNDIHYMLITVRADIDRTKLYHIRDTKAIYDYVFQNYKYHPIINNGDSLVTLSVEYSKEKNRIFNISKNLDYYSDSSFDENKIEITYDGVNLLTHKMKIGDKLGTVTIKYDNELLDTVVLALDKEVDFSLGVYLYENIYVVSIIGISIILFITITIILIHKKRKKKRKK